MVTKSNGFDEKSACLSDRQLKAIPVLLAAKTLAEGARQAGVSRKTLHQWLQNPAFKEELSRQRVELSREAFRLLEKDLGRATQTLLALLDSEDEKVRRSAANNIIDHVMKFREQEELEDRLMALEQKVIHEGSS